MNKNFTALMASVGTQLDVPKLAASKASIVKAVSAGVMAVSLGMTSGVAHAQEASASSHTGSVALGSVIGGVSGWGLGKVFGGGSATRNVMGVVGAVVGGTIASNNAEARDVQQAAAKLAAADSAFSPLAPDRADRMTQLQLDALQKRMAYQTAFKAAREAKLDRELNPGNPEYETKMKRAAVIMMEANRRDLESSKAFISAFEAAQDARFNVAPYAVTYGKLKQPFDVNDQSYAKLSEQVVRNASLENESKAENRGPSM